MGPSMDFEVNLGEDSIQDRSLWEQFFGCMQLFLVCFFSFFLGGGGGAGGG